MRLLYLPLLVFLLSVSSVSSEVTSSDVIVTVDSTSLRFSPSEVTVQEGQTVRFVWSGQALAHNAVADDGLFDSGDPSRDVDYLVVFEVGTAGTYRFVCEPHESVGMVGKVIVEAAPVVIEEEDKELKQTPAVSMFSSILLLILVAVKYRSDDNDSLIKVE